jgi:hypothetical protein
MRCFPRRRRAGSAAKERGAVLIEILAASAILSVLAVGLVNFWAIYDRLGFDLVLRQKAVLVLNGEMERLNYLYTTTGFGAGVKPSTTGYAPLPNIAGSGTRLTYATTSTSVDFVVASASSFALAESLVWLDGAGTAARNYVWLDRDRQLVAQASWMEAPLGAGCSGSCACYAFSGSGTQGVCLVVTLVLDYPYRLQGATVTPLGPLKSLTLSTIAGRRS